MERELIIIELAHESYEHCQKLLLSSTFESLVFLVDDDKHLDLGAMAFPQRARSKTTKARSIYDLQNKSILDHRVCPLKNWASGTITSLKTGQITLATLKSKFDNLRTLTTWCEKNNHESFLNSPEECQIALIEFSIFLKNKTSNSVARREVLFSDALSAARYAFEDSSYHINYPVPAMNLPKHIRESTASVEEHALAEILAISDSLFHQLTKFVLDMQPYPGKILFLGEEINIIPHSRFCLPRAVVENGFIPKGQYVWNYETGNIGDNSPDNYLKHPCGHPKYAFDRGIANDRLEAKYTLTYENLHPRGSYRLRLAKWAHDSFLVLFSIVTGINESILKNLSWSDKYEILRKPDQQGFRGVKARAGDKEIIFNITTKFIEPFKKFLKLRNFILGDRRHDFLFIQLSSYPEEELIISKLKSNSLDRHLKRVRCYLAPNLPSINFRQLRKYKVNNHVAHEGLATASSLMGNTTATIKKSYLDKNADQQGLEIGAFYTKILQAADTTKTSVPAGSCSEIGSPIVSSDLIITKDSNPKSDCKNFLGCIFCENYFIHSDREELRKLLSMRYYINELRICCDDEEHFMTVHGPTLTRIQNILSDIITQYPESKKAIDDVTIEIETIGMLSTYWAEKIKTAVIIGVLT